MGCGQGIPKQLQRLQSLCILRLEGLYKPKLAVVLPESLQEIYISGHSLESIPQEVYTLPHLCILHISNRVEEFWHFGPDLDAMLSIKSLKVLVLICQRYDTESPQGKDWTPETEERFEQAVLDINDGHSEIWQRPGLQAQLMGCNLWPV